MNSGTYKNINAHGVGDNKYHLEWCPKYRYECMQNPFIATEMKQILEQIALEKGIIVHKIVVDSDHVHMFVSVPLDMSVSTAFQYLKGISAYRIFRLHPNFRLRYPKGHFWSPGHFSRSVSNVTESAIEHYIDNHEYPAMNFDLKQRLLFDKSN
jgi:putative transposase